MVELLPCVSYAAGGSTQLARDRSSAAACCSTLKPRAVASFRWGSLRGSRTLPQLLKWVDCSSNAATRSRRLRPRGFSLDVVALAEGEPLLTQQESLTFGTWRVRRIRATEVLAVAAIQGDSFAEPFPLPGLEQVQRQAFKAEVLGILRKKLENCPETTFACLIVERADGDGGVLGVVELSLEDDTRVMRELGRDSPYAYVSCMAVAASHRRQGLATVLLQAAERLAGRWLERCVYLHVYEDNAPAVQLYSDRGYDVCNSDPGWKRLLPGARVRLLMKKQLRS